MLRRGGRLPMIRIPGRLADGTSLNHGRRMLRGIRKASSNWLGKVVMAMVVGFLVISFAIWGIGDIFRGFGRSTVAKIGNTEITIEQFRMLYNDRLQQYSRQLGRPISMEQARAMGLDRLVIGQLVSEIVLDEARQQARSDAFRCRGRQADHYRSGLSGAERPVRPISFRADDPQCRLYRGTLCRRAAPPAAAPPTRGHDDARD